MKQASIAALDRINRRFYRDHAAEFSATRSRPWGGWRRVVETWRAVTAHEPHSILDVGCGNARFAVYLEGLLGDSFDYLGVDVSLSLAGPGLVRWRPGRRLLIADAVHRSLPLACGRRFDLIAAFGLLHHVPSWERRRALLVELAAMLGPGAVLAVSFWQFGADPRFAERRLEWAEFNADADEPVDVEDLEPGDCLLRWGSGRALRYCHWVDTAEAADLTAASGLERLETFAADGAGGRLNRYHLLRRLLASP